MSKKKLFMSIFVVLLAGLLVTSNVFAGTGGKYEGKYNLCMSESGGRSHIYAVNWACDIARGSDQNVCTGWVGPTNSSTSLLVEVASVSGTAPLKIYGMCTDHSDTTSNLWFVNDNGSISGFNINFTRGDWGSPTSENATLDIGKFIQNLTPSMEGGYYVYQRNVRMYRCHSNPSTSCSPNDTLIRLKIGGVPDPPDPDTDLCASWTPASYLSSNPYKGTTSINVKIRNLDPRFGGTGFGDWNDNTIWAKPTDDIEWHTCYYPGVQATAETPVSSVNTTEWSGVPELPTTYCASPSATFKPLKTVTYTWANRYYMSGADNGGATRGDTTGKSGTIGSVLTMFSENGRLTQLLDVGKTFTEVGTTDKPIQATISFSNPTYPVYTNTCGACPCTTSGCTGTVPCYGYCCTNRYANAPLANAAVSYGPASDSVSVKIPYNFVNDTAVYLDSSELYAGETIKVNKVQASVNTRGNSVTIDNYATKVPHAEVKLYAYVSTHSNGERSTFESSNGDGCATAGAGSKQCLYIKGTGDIPLNSSGDLAGDLDADYNNKVKDLRGTYNAFDASAGDYMCFVSAIWPSESAGDRDMSGSNGLWRYSEPACKVIAKKPTFQVWGGSLYAVGGIDANEGNKRNIYNNYYNSWNNLNRNGGFKKTGNVSHIIHFTSWVEESMILKSGTTKTVASGAATGINNNVAKAGNASEFCTDRAALSFANYFSGFGNLCNGTDSVGNSGIDNTKDREELIEYWTGASGGAINSPGGTYNLGNPGSVGDAIASASGERIRYLYASGDVNLSGTVPQETTYLIKSNGVVTITGDLKYDSSYNLLRQIPKVIIYARDVNIKCGVNEVDAIIITGNGGTGTVNTCSEHSDNTSDLENPNRARQLRIFGMVITDKIILGRTYGNAANKDGTKTDSHGIPSDGAAAEIFDYDSSILMWSEYMAGSAETDTVQQVYQRELAPRY